MVSRLLLTSHFSPPTHPKSVWWSSPYLPTYTCRRYRPFTSVLGGCVSVRSLHYTPYRYPLTHDRFTVPHPTSPLSRVLPNTYRYPRLKDLVRRSVHTRRSYPRYYLRRSSMDPRRNVHPVPIRRRGPTRSSDSLRDQLNRGRVLVLMGRLKSRLSRRSRLQRILSFNSDPYTLREQHAMIFRKVWFGKPEESLNSRRGW